MSRAVGGAVGAVVALVCVLVVGLVMAGGAVVAIADPAAGAAAPGASSGGLTDVPPLGQHRIVPAELLPGVPPGGYHDIFAWGQCTWWAALNHRVTWNGDAWEWPYNAAAQGVALSGQPAVGEIVAFARTPGAGQWGHVAIVVAVGDGWFTVSESNVFGLGVVDLRTLPWPDPLVEAFIP